MKAAVVIGAGIGGLSSAVRLASKGVKVTLLEKEPRVGGYAIAYRRGGYTFDLSLHVIPCGGPGEEFSAMVDSLGIADTIQFVRLRKGFQVILGNYRFQMANNYQELREELAGEFVNERQNLDRFFRDLEKKVINYAGIFDYTVSKWRSVPRFFPQIPSFLKYCRLSAREYLEHFFRDEYLMAILYLPASFMGIPMRQFPAVNFMIMFYLLIYKGMYTVVGGGQAFTDALQGKFKSLGGEVLTNTKASSIIVKKKKAVGVVTEDGRQYDCDLVVCGNNIRDVVNRMIGRDHFAPSYLKNLDGLSSSLSVMALNMGLDCHPRKIGLDAYITMAFPDSDIDRCFAKQEKEIVLNGYSLTTPCNAYSASYADGCYTVSLISGTDPGRWMEMDENSYEIEKQNILKAAIDQVDQLFPEFSSHVRVADLATPRTMQRYTANPEGAIMGFKCTRGMHRRIMKAANIPVGNLVIGGAWSSRLGGYMQCMKSGILAADTVS